MKINVLWTFLLIMSCCSCVEKEDDSDLYYFHYSYKVNGQEYDVYQGRPGRGWGNGYYNSGEYFGDVTFTCLSYCEDRAIPQKWHTDKNIIMFEFFYRLGNGWRWFVNAPYINDGEKNYFDKTQTYLKERDYQYRYQQIWDFTQDMMTGDDRASIESGWMSFTRKVDDPNIILRVEFDATFESKYPRFGEKLVQDTTYKYHISDGLLDFTTKMAGRIIGGKKLR